MAATARFQLNPLITSTADQRIAVIQWTAGKQALRENPIPLVGGLIATAAIAFVCFRTGTFNKLGTASTVVLGLATTAFVTYKKVIAPAFEQKPVASQLVKEEKIKKYATSVDLYNDLLTLKSRLFSATPSNDPIDFAPPKRCTSFAAPKNEVTLCFSTSSENQEIKLHREDFEPFQVTVNAAKEWTPPVNLEHAKGSIGYDLIELGVRAHPFDKRLIQSTPSSSGASKEPLTNECKALLEAKISLIAKFIIIAHPFIHSGTLTLTDGGSSDLEKDRHVSSPKKQTLLSVYETVESYFSFDQTNKDWLARASITYLADFLSTTRPITWYDSNGELIDKSEAF